MGWVMQKINRDALKEAVVWYENYGDGNGLISQLHKAAAAFLEITDPEFVPSEGMQIAGRDCKFNGKKSTNPKDVFRAMMKELTE